MDLDEFVVRQIVMKRIDDPIPPKINSWRGGHALIGIGVAQDIQPVAGVTDRVLFIGEQAVDDLFVGIRRLVRNELLLLGRRRWNANQVQMDPSQ